MSLMTVKEERTVLCMVGSVTHGWTIHVLPLGVGCVKRLCSAHIMLTRVISQLVCCYNVLVVCCTATHMTAVCLCGVF